MDRSNHKEGTAPDHAAQTALLAMTPEERERASLAESEWAADFFARNPDEVVCLFEDGDAP
jgi:hypothetical protein